MQLEDCIDMINSLHSKFDKVCDFNYSNMHDYQHPDRLNRNNMGVKHSGSELSMHDSYA